jgi:hypothetical protein
MEKRNRDGHQPQVSIPVEPVPIRREKLSWHEGRTERKARMTGRIPSGNGKKGKGGRPSQSLFERSEFDWPGVFGSFWAMQKEQHIKGTEQNATGNTLL